MSRELTSPSERLIAAASLAAAIIFDGEKIGSLNAIDVGCDHAKLAVYLVQSRICEKVLATDIGIGPISKARETVKRRKFRKDSLEKYITVMQNDGLQNLEKENPNRVFILGMGGDLISDIINRADYFKDTTRKTAFVLQAMTSENSLRKFLAENGFCILKEQLVKDKERIYSLILCVYDGNKRTFSEAVYYVGEYNVNNPHKELFLPYIDRKIRACEKISDNMKNAGVDNTSALELTDELKALREKALAKIEM